MFLHLIVIAWLYVAVMMAVAEATHSSGTVLGGIITFLLYGLGPVALVVYLLNTPARRRVLKEREAAAQDEARRAAQAAAPPAPPADPATPASHSGEPEARREATADAVAPVREET